MKGPFVRRRNVYGLTVCLLTLLPGCLIPFGFPKLSQTPPALLGEEVTDVHAFRVDITTDFADMSGTDHYTLSEMPSWSASWLLPQTKVSATYGIFVLGIALNYPVFMSHSLAAKLYRPGYDLVELDSWNLPVRIAWKRAEDLKSQKRALDRLFLMDREAEATKPKLWPFIGRSLSAGSESSAHRRALLFGASEYERLASRELALGPEWDGVRSELRSKAEELRKVADKKEPSSSLSRLICGE